MTSTNQENGEFDPPYIALFHRLQGISLVGMQEEHLSLFNLLQ
jgi:hypothetical protein